MAAVSMSGTGLLVIDVQVGIGQDAGGGPSSNADCDGNISQILETFRNSSMAVMHVQHLSTDASSALHPSKKTVQFERFALPKSGEPIFTKTTSSAFASSALEEGIRSQEIKRLVVVGKVTNGCVNSTIRSASDMGVVGEGGEIVLVSDATACYEVPGVDAATVHKAHVGSLDGDFCRVTSTKDLLNEVRGWA